MKRMQRRDIFRIRGNTLPFTLVAGVIVAFVTLLGTVMVDTDNDAEANISFMYDERPYVIGDTFTVDIMVDARVPTNVFAGEVTFDPASLTVDSISYNTSIADLWAVRPWYENGDGTVNFAGGTTQPGGFTGTGPLISITFRAKNANTSSLTLRDTHILRHDGLGSDAHLHPSIDAIVTTIEANASPENAPVVKETVPVIVLYKKPDTDLNSDGTTSIADVSIFMLHLSTNNSRSDFNEDGVVSAADLSILLEAR